MRTGGRVRIGFSGAVATGWRLANCQQLAVGWLAWITTHFMQASESLLELECGEHAQVFDIRPAVRDLRWINCGTY